MWVYCLVVCFLLYALVHISAFGGEKCISGDSQDRQGRREYKALVFRFKNIKNEWEWTNLRNKRNK